jgi:hypothetical protein
LGTLRAPNRHHRQPLRNGHDLVPVRVNVRCVTPLGEDAASIA